MLLAPQCKTIKVLRKKIIVVQEKIDQRKNALVAKNKDKAPRRKTKAWKDQTPLCKEETA